MEKKSQFKGNLSCFSHLGIRKKGRSPLGTLSCFSRKARKKGRSPLGTLSCFSHLRIRKKGEVLNRVIVHLVLIGLIFAIFIMATAGRINGRDVKQQILEKEIALLIDSAEPGMEFGVQKVMKNGVIGNIEIKESKVFVMVEGLASYKGYPYFSKYSVSVRGEGNKFIISVR